jgi:hypothetical protein
VYTLDIDMTDKADVGATASFMAHYDRSVILMRWIRRAYDRGELYRIR